MGFQQHFNPNGVDGETAVNVQLPESWRDEGRSKDGSGGGRGGGWFQMLMREDPVPLSGPGERAGSVLPGQGEEKNWPPPSALPGIYCCSDRSHLPRGPGWCWRGAHFLVQSRPEKGPGELGE